VKKILKRKMGKSNALMAPVHPGEILREDFMKPLGLPVTGVWGTGTRGGEMAWEKSKPAAI
jgi:hypothetical protein